MKVRILKDERYPELVLQTDTTAPTWLDDRCVFEVDAETVARWQKVAEEFDRVQDEIAAVRGGY